MLKVYSDGGSRGNPGPSAIAFIILSEKDTVLRKRGRCIGTGTNNQAEYKALIEALECALEEESNGDVKCFLDSEVVVRQLKGEYEVRNPTLEDLYLKVKRLQDKFDSISFVRVPRTDEHMQEVDSMVNQTLDRTACERGRWHAP